MSGAFQYKPKFVDIRVRPPREDEDDVNALRPGERRCEHPDCLQVATAKAPKSRDRLDEHYWFCQAHAAEYNRSWNFFAGMSELEMDRRRAEAATGERPTWQFRASRFSREAAAASTRGSGFSFSDPFGIFRASRRRAEAEAEAA